jgi:hypothetical protein
VANVVIVVAPLLEIISRWRHGMIGLR